MDKPLSEIVADLFVKAKGNEDLPSKIHRLRDEIKKVIENENTIFGKFHELVESFREILPEEKQRYNAAIKALSTTSKLSRQEIVQAVSGQLEELKILEKNLMSTLPGWRDELNVMEAKSQKTKEEISKLREVLARLENEEKEILNGMANRKKEVESVEKTVGELFAEIRAEITYVRNKVEEFTADRAASQPGPSKDSAKIDIFGGEKSIEEKSGEQASETSGPAATKETGWQKKCPMCGGRMDFYGHEKKWQCYVCAYEESAENEE